MNASHNTHAQTHETGGSALSALVDGELLPDELDAVLASLDEYGAEQDRWNHYQVIGDALRGSAALTPALAATRSSQDFLAGIRAQLQTAEPDMDLRAGLLPVAALQKDMGPANDSDAANDAVFRWKMVAGLASLAAVMAVSWTVLDSVPGGSGAGAGPQLAQTGPSAVQMSASGRIEPMVVETPQGPVLRDPQLEALMAQHRQHGSPSALQMPTGFLRNATYDAPVR
jgi:sigma-E factor negative regulatory protein RseA